MNEIINVPLSEDIWTVTRSYLDDRVWVPYGHEGDQSCFLYAGTLRAVKHWVTTQMGDMSEFKWVKEGDRHWLLVRR